MQAELKAIYTHDYGDFSQLSEAAKLELKQLRSFEQLVDLAVGPSDNNSSDIFSILFISPDRATKGLRGNPIVQIIDIFDTEAITKLANELVAKCSESAKRMDGNIQWRAFVECMQEFSLWEFEQQNNKLGW